MITLKYGDITKERGCIIAHGVNCKGVMGSGVAKAIRDTWPHVYEIFKASYNQETYLKIPHECVLGLCHLIHVADNPLTYVMNCYTQLDYGKDGKRYADPKAVRECLEVCFESAVAFDLPLKAPKIGAGLGGLSWEREVLPIFEELNIKYPTVNVEILYI